jgi:hypothetical protein
MTPTRVFPVLGNQGGKVRLAPYPVAVASVAPSGALVVYHFAECSVGFVQTSERYLITAWVELTADLHSKTK